MLKAEFYVVYINRRPDVSFDTVEAKMNFAVDWYRINETLWVLYSTSDAETWYARLSPFAKDIGRLFICKLDINGRQGWMNKDFWSWLKREKKPPAK